MQRLNCTAATVGTLLQATVPSPAAAAMGSPQAKLQPRQLRFASQSSSPAPADTSGQASALTQQDAEVPATGMVTAEGGDIGAAEGPRSKALSDAAFASFVAAFNGKDRFALTEAELV